MAEVIGNDDLLRLGFPSFLVHAALVCKRWRRRVATEPAFLRRFRDRHPPRLLGFYVRSFSPRPLFVPISEAKEIRSAVSHAGVDDIYQCVRIAGCRNGRLLLMPGSFRCGGYNVFSPLCPTGSLPILPPLEPHHIHRLRPPEYNFFRDNSDDIFSVSVLLSARKLSTQVYVMQPGAWGDVILAEGELPVPPNFVRSMTIVHDKLYIVTNNGYICGLDFITPHPQLSFIEVPDKVNANFKISHGADSGLFLIHGDEFHLSVWHHEMDDNGEDMWELVDRFLVRVAHDGCERFQVCGVGEDGGFVFLCLWTSKGIISFDFRSRKEKVYEIKVQGIYCTTIFPLMTIWPPTFPTLNDEVDQSE